MYERERESSSEEEEEGKREVAPHSEPQEPIPESPAKARGKTSRGKAPAKRRHPAPAPETEDEDDASSPDEEDTSSPDPSTVSHHHCCFILYFVPIPQFTLPTYCFLFQPPLKRTRTQRSLGQGLSGKPLAALLQQCPIKRQSWKVTEEEMMSEDDVISVSSASSREGKIESVQLVVANQLKLKIAQS